MTRRLILKIAGIVFCASTSIAGAEVTRLDIQRRVIVESTPQYELLIGIAAFSVDPNNARNAMIADLDKAPRSASGRVEFSADIAILRPVDPAVANGAWLVDIVNRGNKQALRMFNRAQSGNSLSTAAELGDGFLMKRGYTVAWVGWQADLAGADAGLMRLRAPVATNAGAPLLGWVRVQRTPSSNVATLPLADEHHVPYAVVDPGSSQHVLTMREAGGPLQIVPRDKWRFVGDGGTLATAIMLAGGFGAGLTYELVYRAAGPVVAGLGLAAIRDVATFVRNDRRAPFRAQRAIAFGVSQSGRLLRSFLYDGFNQDEAGRQVFDAFFIHVAGSSRGSFNQRFGQPSSSDATATLFPFADIAQVDPQTRRSDALLGRLGVQRPKIFYTNSSTEYWWLRRAALQHTSIDGLSDLALPTNVRLYLLASTQHIPASFPPPTESSARTASNPNDYRWSLRALLVALDAWVKDEAKLPPVSAYPRLDDATLVPVARINPGEIPGVDRPRALVERTLRFDFGPEFHRGIADYEPPHEGGPLPVLLPQVDADGNEIAGVRLPEIAVPLGTYTGWNLRRPENGGRWLVGLIGSFVPFARTRDERSRRRDPRLSIEERYGSSEVYLAKYRDAAIALIDKRYLLEDDMTSIMTEAAGRWLVLTKK